MVKLVKETVKLDADGRVKCGFAIDLDIYASFKNECRNQNLRAQQVIQAAMNSFCLRKIKLDGKELVSACEIVSTGHVARETIEPPVTRAKAGRPPKAVDDSNKPPWERSNKDTKNLMEWRHEIVPLLERDEAPNLLLSTKDEDGKTWRQYIEEEWLSWRVQIDDDDAWFHTSLWLIIEGAECKFRNYGVRNYRFRRNETGQEIIDLNQELTIRYSDEIDRAMAARQAKREG